MTTTRIFLVGIGGLIVLVSVTVFTAMYADNYERLIRFLFERLTDTKITFTHQGKDLHFVSMKFMVAPPVFTLCMFVLLRRQAPRQRIRNVLLAILIGVIATVLITYFASMAELAVCTACHDGRRVLQYRDIKYDRILIETLVAACIPSVVTALIKRKF